MINRQLLMATTAAVVLAMPAVSGAQDGASPAVPVTQDAQPDQVDEIVVTGIRRSIQDAISAKRNSDILLDTISAEDIGKLPDQNIAETLSRIPGVQISRVEGGGQQVTVRGLGLNRLLLNGNSFIGSANNGDPNLGDVSPELLGSVDVIKAPAADLVEGWLGAIIDLKTKRPLDYVEPILAFRLQGSHADQIDDYGYKASGVLSRRFLDGTLGALVGFSYAESSGRTDLYQSGGWSRQRADVNGDGVVDTFFRPNRLQTIINQYEDERWALNGTLQWRPFQQLTITLSHPAGRPNARGSRSRRS
jgi:iron complex outermembrane recepter protein